MKTIRDMIVYILANPHAGNGQAFTIVKNIREMYPQVWIESYVTTSKNDEYAQVEAILSVFRKDQDRFLILGGDGTLSKVLAIWPKEFPFAYFPTGSGNDFARAVGIQSWQQVMETILTTPPVPVCVLSLPEGVVINSLDIGYPARVIAHSEKTAFKKWFNRLKIGKLTYIFFGVLGLFNSSQLSACIEVNQQKMELEHLFFLSVANNTYFGGGIMIWPDAHIKTPQMDLVYVSAPSIFQRIKALLELILKRHKTSSVLHHITAETIKLTLPHKIVAQVDGELQMIQEMTISCQTRYYYLGKE
ncbi:diacylglycerol kinase family protein [Streptococcus sp. ZJ93]|uniref:diacylglycerol/lipid kinase family protein n=1 Tax=Streptococcus handemini TaxID=3161188 RepID=UPI0032ED628C